VGPEKDPKAEPDISSVDFTPSLSSVSWNLFSQDNEQVVAIQKRTITNVLAGLEFISGPPLLPYGFFVLGNYEA
jgi:hypothetical protein